MVAKTLGLYFGYPDKKSVELFSGSDFMWDEKLASDISYNTIKRCKNPVTL